MAAGGRAQPGVVSPEPRHRRHLAVLTNLPVIQLVAAGSSLDDVIKVNVFLTDMADFPAMNAVYRAFFAEPYPARTTVAVAGLPLGAAVEVELVARAR